VNLVKCESDHQKTQNGMSIVLRGSSYTILFLDVVDECTKQTLENVENKNDNAPTLQRSVRLHRRLITFCSNLVIIIKVWGARFGNSTYAQHDTNQYNGTSCGQGDE